jgi:SAM-dependent methyltransferase
VLTEQYRSPANLNARIALHERYSTNRVDWFRWVFDYLPVAAETHLLELGCGPGRLWLTNRDRIPVAWTVILSDGSPGMCRAAQTNLEPSADRFAFVVADAQAIPLAAGTIDVVIANHMLYHVPDRSRAFAEIGRVLRPGGRLVAATNGVDYMAEVSSLARRFDPALANAITSGDLGFALESGAAQLRPWFDEVVRHRYQDELVVTEAAPLTAYILSAVPELDNANVVSERGVAARLEALIQQELDERGPLRVSKVTGLFTAKRPIEA